VQTRSLRGDCRTGSRYRWRLALVLLQALLCSSEKLSTAQSRHLSSSISLFYCGVNTCEIFLCSVTVTVTLSIPLQLGFNDIVGIPGEF
jgi:hypothetical protein